MPERLIPLVETLTEEVRGLRADISHRPTRAEIDRRRRLTVLRIAVAVLWVVLVAASLQDQHVEKCGPGSRAETIISRLRDGKVTTPAEFKRLADKKRPGYCEVMFPLHTHDPGDWPSGLNAVGLGLYAGVLVVSIGLVRPRNWERETHEDHHLEGPVDPPHGSERLPVVDEEISDDVPGSA